MKNRHTPQLLDSSLPLNELTARFPLVSSRAASAAKLLLGYVHDHWSSRPHLAERMRLVMVLLNFLELNQQDRCKAVLLSGDVHVGALGQLWYERKQLGISQVISSGIVHPAPSAFQWAGIQLMTGDKPEALGDGDVTAELLTPFGSPRYLRTRNFATLHIGTDRKMWVNWVCENENWKPSFAIS